MSSYWLVGALLVALGAGPAVAATAQQAPSGGRVLNVTEKRETRANPDRWKRGEDQAASSSDDEDPPKEHRGDHDEEPAKPPAHRGELNGKLDLGSW